MTDTTINEPKSEIRSRSTYFNPERRWVLGFALITMLITTLPYLLGYWAQGNAWQFSGFIFGVDDGNNYIAKMLRGATGDWLFRTPYSAYPQQGVLAYFPHILLGKLASPPGQHEKLVSLYHLARVVSGILMILATYDFIALFIKNIRWRRWGVVLASWGGGLGWILIILGYENWLGTLPLAFYSPETFGFIMLYGIPHLALARALFFWGLLGFLRHQNENLSSAHSNRIFTSLVESGVISGLLWLLMGLLQPLTVVLAWTIVGLDTLIRVLIPNSQNDLKRRFFSPEVRKFIIAVLVSSPIVIYTVVGFSADEFHRTWTAQIITLAPHPWHYVVAYGLLLPFAIAGVINIFKLKLIDAGFLVAWLIALPFLLAVPIGMQRRLVEGFWVALIILALIALDQLQEPLSKMLQYLFILAFPSTLFLLLGGYLAAVNPIEPLFRPVDEVAAFNFLAENTDGEAVVLSSFDTGNPMPAWASVFVVIGHGPESVFLSELEPRVIAFYQTDTPDVQRWDLLTEFDVDYVFWGPAEQELGDWEPGSVRYLSLVHQSGDYEIYKVNLTGQ